MTLDVDIQKIFMNYKNIWLRILKTLLYKRKKIYNKIIIYGLEKEEVDKIDRQRGAEFINYYRGDFFFKKNNKLDQLNMYYFYLRNSIIIALNYMLINMNIFVIHFNQIYI